MIHRFRLRAALLLVASVAPQSASAAANNIDTVAVTESEDGSSASIAIESRNLLRYRIQPGPDPLQVQIVMEDDVPCEKQPIAQDARKVIREIRYDCGPSAKPKAMKALSVFLAGKCSWTVSQRDWILSLTFKREGALPAKPAAGLAVPAAEKAEPVPPPAPQAPSPPYSGQFVIVGSFEDAKDLESGWRGLSARPYLDEFIEVGLANHKPLEIARKELELAKYKLFEARRNFFPTVAARGTQSEGATLSNPSDISSRADFRRKELGVEVGQTLFQSGRIFYSQRLARALADIAELQIAKITRDHTYDIFKALYALLQAEESLTYRKALLAESNKIVETTRRKKEIGVASESEYLGVLSIGNQISYKAVSQEKDYEIARTRLISVLNVDSLPADVQVRMNDLVLKEPILKLEMDGLILMAMANRPEVKIAQLTRAYKESARKVARAENMVKLDATAFVGQSGAAFQSEALTLKDSYNVGVRAVVKFGGNSISPLVSREKTAPDLGSNSRTETRAESVTIGLLDSMESRSAYLQAKIDEDKARDDFRKARKDVTLEVKEAFFNYQRGKIQIESARKELDYRKKEVAIAQVKDKLHQVEAPQYLQTIAGLTEAETGYREAMAFYLTSLAALEKSIGQSLVR